MAKNSVCALEPEGILSEGEDGVKEDVEVGTKIQLSREIQHQLKLTCV